MFELDALRRELDRVFDEEEADQGYRERYLRLRFNLVCLMDGLDKENPCHRHILFKMRNILELKEKTDAP